MEKNGKKLGRNQIGDKIAGIGNMVGIGGSNVASLFTEPFE